MKYFSVLIFCFSLLIVSCENQKKPNVLFIAVDDLRPQMFDGDKPLIVTPNLDKLASEGTRFLRHYVQVPTCGASRFSMLTGMRPKEKVHLSNEAIKILMAQNPDTTKEESFVEVLKNNGYTTVGIGKISHYPDGKLYTYSGEGDGAPEMPRSWTEMMGPVGKWETSWNAFFGYADGSNRNTLKNQVYPYENGDVDDMGYPDGLTAELAINKLDELSKQDTPFFLGVGFFKPHLPFTAPKKYWDLYNENSIPVSTSPEVPKNGLPNSLHSSGEMFGGYKKLEEKGGLGIQLSDSTSKKLRHAYFAAASYSDNLIGKVIQKLKDIGEYDNTLIIIWGDHGWLLGDHTLWGKHSLYESALRSELIIKAPGNNQNGTPTSAIVETVDLYPTILDLVNIKTESEMDGLSLKPFLEDPKKSSLKPAISFWKNGLSVRTDAQRIISYGNNSEAKYELYDLQNTLFEEVNIYPQNNSMSDSLEVLLSGHRFEHE